MIFMGNDQVMLTRFVDIHGSGISVLTLIHFNTEQEFYFPIS